MKIIYKYPLLNEVERVHIPRGAEVLSVQRQHGIPCVWALVDTEQPTEVREFETFLTGQPIEHRLRTRKHIGTLQSDGGNYVTHVFEIK